MSLPTNRIARDLIVEDVESHRKLHSVNKISSIFREVLEDEHVHILVQRPRGAFHRCLSDYIYSHFQKLLPLLTPRNSCCSIVSFWTTGRRGSLSRFRKPKTSAFLKTYLYFPLSPLADSASNDDQDDQDGWDGIREVMVREVDERPRVRWRMGRRKV